MTRRQWVISLREKGLMPSGINLYVRTVNSYLTWLHEEGHLPEALKLKLLKTPQRQLILLTSADLKAILLHRPKFGGERRIWTLILLLLDTASASRKR